MVVLRNILIFLAWLGLVKKPRKHLYAVELQVVLDGELICSVPAQTEAYNRRWAKRIALNRLSVGTGTTAVKSITEKGKYLVPLRVYLDNKLFSEGKVFVKAKKSREAKFDVTKRLVLKVGATARVAHLIKHS